MSRWWPDRVGGIGDEAGTDLATQIAAHQLLGWRHLELRTVDGIPVAELPAPAVEELVGRVADTGFSVPCLDSAIGNWAGSVGGPLEPDLAELDALGALAAQLGTRFIRVMSYPNDGLAEPEWRAEVVRRFRVLASRAAGYDLVLLHENCAGWASTSAERTLDLLEAVDSPNLAVLFDVGNPVAHGYPGPGYLTEVLPWVRHVHVKDAVPDGHGALFTDPGRGVAELAWCVQTLLAHGYDGLFCAEPHVAVLPHRGRRADRETVLNRYLDYGRKLGALLDRVAP